MKHLPNEIHNLRAKTESSPIKTEESNQILAQIDASLARKEGQKVKENTKKYKIHQ